MRDRVSELQTTATRALLRQWTAIMRELRRRNVVRTNNSPIGDIAEALPPNVGHAA